MDRLAHRAVAAEAEGDVRDAAGHQGVRQVVLDPAGRLDVVGAVGRVLLDARRHREDVRVEDDVLGGADLVDEDPVGPLADDLAALERVGLALLVERHDDDSGAVLARQAGVLAERLLALLHRDRVDDRLALGDLEARLDDLPLAGVDHERDAADVGLGRDEPQEPVHRRDAVDHPLVHVDVDDLGARLDLLAGDVEGRGVVLLGDQAAEAGRARDVRALADVDEEAVPVDDARLEAGEPQRPRHVGGHAGACRPGAAAIAAMCSGVVPRHPPTMLTRPAVANSPTTRAIASGVSSYSPKALGRPAFGWAETKQSAMREELRDVGARLTGAERTVEADCQGPGVAHGVPERLGHLPREVRPDASVIVPEIMTGQRRSCSSNSVSSA